MLPGSGIEVLLAPLVFLIEIFLVLVNEEVGIVFLVDEGLLAHLLEEQ